ncbi:MAG: hypothetical protein K2L24_03445 [Opitutales bacterium]|nr:hypothetical protein [Opitutales bacterium]
MVKVMGVWSCLLLGAVGTVEGSSADMVRIQNARRQLLVSAKKANQQLAQTIRTIKTLASRQPSVAKDSKYVIPPQLGQIAAVPKKDATVLVPPGFRLYNVPGDGLCGFWAVLVVKKIAEQHGARDIYVKKSEVLALLKRLSDRIAYVRGKQDRTPEDTEALEEIATLIANDTEKKEEDLNNTDWNQFLRKLEQGRLELDSPLTVFLAPVIGFDILVKKEEFQKGLRKIITHTYKGNFQTEEDPIPIFYRGDGRGGHYQSIVPQTCNIHIS